MNQSQPDKRFILTCKKCGNPNEFNQPYPYHAGFSDMGFLYNESGNSTLTWSMYDPYFIRLFPQMAAWDLSPLQKERFETILPPSPKGDRWSFTASARCLKCKSSISDPMGSTIYFLLYPDSINTSGPGKDGLWLESYCIKST
jgi:hypothetical protein